ncbi:uncharacterized protein LOC126378256 [Pectinophora gossypiella]|uniref:uncharacterized protein LOC126378256 n=1 Tax=Pectinophora gossypiella TaxID=13191 RepID=UPI00214F1FA7|nr:uncharacterized protein LOC126378256 [Pectinophora gossypiella]
MFCVSLLLIHTHEDMVLLRRVNSADKKMLESLRSQLMADNMDYDDKTTPASVSGSTSDEHHPMDDITQIEDHSAISAELHTSSRELLPPPRLHPRVQYAPVYQKHTPRKKRIPHKMKLPTDSLDRSFDPIKPSKHTSTSTDPFLSIDPSFHNGVTSKHSPFSSKPNQHRDSFIKRQDPILIIASGHQNSQTAIQNSANNCKKDLPTQNSPESNPKLTELFNQYLQPLKPSSGYQFRAFDVNRTHDYSNVKPIHNHHTNTSQTREVPLYQGPDQSPNDKVSLFKENSEFPSQTNAYLSPIHDGSIQNTPSSNINRNLSPSNDNIEPHIQNPTNQNSDTSYPRLPNQNQGHHGINDNPFPSEQKPFKQDQFEPRVSGSQPVDQNSPRDELLKHVSLHKHVKLVYNPYHPDPAPAPPPQYHAYRYVPTTRSTTTATRMTFRMNTLPDELSGKESKERTKKSRFTLKRRDDPEDRPSRTFKGFKVVDGMEVVSEHSEEKWEQSDSGTSPQPEKIMTPTVTEHPDSKLHKAVLKAEARIAPREPLVSNDNNNKDHREEYLRLKYTFGVL